MTTNQENTTKNTKASPSKPYSIGLEADLRDPEIAAEYLNAAFEDRHPQVVLLALKDILKANGEISQFAKNTNMSRQAIYSMLSENGNPTLQNFNALLNQIGIKMTFCVDERS